MNYLLLAASYLLGAVPFGLVIGKLAGKDVRKEGSKNIGATNVSRLLGKKLGFVTLICDCLKGYLPMLMAATLLENEPNVNLMVALCGIAAVLGHMFPIYLGFKGGKGVATGLGVFLYLSPLAILISLGVFAGSVALSGFVSVGSLLSSALMVIWLWLLGQSKITMMTAAIVAALIWLKHHENIGRLLKGEEKSWKKK
ncbi:glycerol-3-phosphate 1-O-acyltransferase PlsY [Desulfopila aestuarii]|uniref:Glycerol-3-phosphate acyltransferase n=1 Tax=Desulfopila aestuarii DSM 18488 TaxID=1121416 RepID=A0A1M7Y9V1_9BACT|nr:glycerol-3-phosphate 1-O-acyltransferase PlsY [Desulfopila aestuarii]SHO49413.1 acyl-phosphate glycerol-3-phosphate acyltransferase [Desulfopila aestuarii DSM 18488]